MRARTAVSRPSASQPAVSSMRIGCRLGCMRIDSRRVSATLDRPPGDPRQQRRVRLHDEVLLAAERAAVGDQLDATRSSGSAEDARAPARRSSNMPCPCVHRCSAAVAGGLGERALGLEEQVLDALGAATSRDHVRAGGERGVGVAAADDRVRQQVVVHRVDAAARPRAAPPSGRRARAASGSYVDLDQLAPRARATISLSAATAASTSPTQRTSSPTATNTGQSA